MRDFLRALYRPADGWAPPAALPSAPKAPPPPPDPTPIPDLNDPAILAARRRKLDDVMSRSGRASTQLADGGDAYSGDKLGLR